MTLPDGMDFLIRPVEAGMCRYESLRDGTLTLEDILLMNAYLDNRAHNLAEVRKWQASLRDS
jgi:hypothetical protein|nr:MAG TPA: hypothetical protein [Caudoviricetes sp.]